MIADFVLEARHDPLPVIGIDEVGRGCLAGPVMACAAFIPARHRGQAVFREVRDSKLLTRACRGKIAARLAGFCIAATATATVQEIDQLNILAATLLAMQRAFEKLIASLAFNADHSQLAVLVDGNQMPAGLRPFGHSVIGGDRISATIASASILAKVRRDRMMRMLGVHYPHYGWRQNAGYGTLEHRRALAEFGASKWHRRSFAPVAALERSDHA